MYNIHFRAQWNCVCISIMCVPFNLLLILSDCHLLYLLFGLLCVYKYNVQWSILSVHFRRIYILVSRFAWENKVWLDSWSIFFVWMTICAKQAKKPKKNVQTVQQRISKKHARSIVCVPKKSKHHYWASLSDYNCISLSVDAEKKSNKMNNKKDTERQRQQKKKLASRNTHF